MSSQGYIRPGSLPLEVTTSPMAGRVGSTLTLGWLCTVTSTVLLLLQGLIGSLGAAGFLLVWVLYGAIRPDLVVRTIPLLGILWLFPLLGLVSTLWSEATVLTARSSVQYILTILCAAIAAQATPPRQLISAVMTALFIMAVLSLVAGNYDVDPMTGAHTFIGIFASKNFFAFFLSLLFLAAAAVAVDKRQPLLFRAVGVCAFVLAMPLLVMTRSATSLVVSVACFGILMVTLFFVKMSPKWRAVFLISCIAAGIYVGAVLTGNAQIFELFITKVLGKDTTLTGRTYLWAKAAGLIAQDPILGRGFQAFWRHDNLEAEALWRYFHISGRGGFHFHNTYVEIKVGLGHVGLVAFVGSLLVIARRLLSWFVESMSLSAAFFITVLSCILIRSFVEIDVIYQFQIGTFMLFALAVCARPEVRRTD